MVVQHNLTAMNANRMLGLTQATQAKSTEKLSSGYKINRAADDAAGLSISEKMRKQIRGLTQASLNAQDGISAVQTAEGALTEVQDMLQRMNELAVKASNGTMSEDDRGYIQDEIEQLVDEIDRVAETTKFNETYMLKGDKNGTKSTTYDYASRADYLAEGKELYTKDSDGNFTKLEEGTLLNDSTQYYTALSSTVTDFNVGEKIVFSDAKVVGDALDSGNSANYLESANVVSASGLYTYDSGKKLYEAVETGTKYDSSKTYYTLSTVAGGSVDYTAASMDSTNSSTYIGSATVVKSGSALYDSNAKQMAVGTSVDSTTLSNYYTAVDKSKDSQRYIEQKELVSETGLYIKNSSGAYEAVASGTAYDSDATYYSMESQSGGSVNYVATTKKPGTTTGWVAKSEMYDANGNQVAVGAAVDTSKNYYTNVTASTQTTYDATSVASSNLSAYKDDAANFHFKDKDGNDVAANGLYRYFNEDGSYKGGLYKTSDNALVEVDSTEANAYVEKGESKKGTLSLSLHVGADATENNQITLNIEAMDAETLGISGVRVDGADDKNALNTIATVKEALQKISTQRSALGAIQNRLEHTINNLDNVVENTTSAESQIRDTDMATEMVKYSNNNILAQAGQAMLAQANQSNQGVLSLLG